MTKLWRPHESAASFVGGGVAVVEWADRIGDLWPPDTLEVELVPEVGGGRLARIRGPAVFGWVRDALGAGEA